MVNKNNTLIIIMTKQPNFELLVNWSESEAPAKVPITIINFPDGEPHVKLNFAELKSLPCEDCLKFMLEVPLKNSASVLIMLKIVDAIRNHYFHAKIHAMIPYIPGSRGDRVMEDGEAFSMRVYAELINSCEFDKVYCVDPHSEVTNALIKNLVIVKNHAMVKTAMFISMMEKATLVSPDSGANKKIKDLAEYISIKRDVEVLKCDKTRNVATGKITGFEVYADKLDPERNYVIVDDICDGGGTFTGLGKVMLEKGAVNLHLVVSHGIFSKGFDDLLKIFKSIHYCSIFDIPERTGTFQHNYLG